MGTFLSQALKASEGSKHWLKFFAVTGSAFASLEKYPPLAQYAHLSEMETCEMVRAMEYELGVIEKLRAYDSAVQASANSDKAAHYYLLVLKPSEKMVLIIGFSKDDLAKATEMYLKEEKNISGDGLAQVVLVAAQSIDALRKAYPNYFLDTHEFVRALRRVISHKKNMA